MSQDIDKVKEIIENSGNKFHFKVLKKLQEKDWTVLISPYYNDNVTGKPREIDLIAEKAFKASGKPGQVGYFNYTINIKLFIECKYIRPTTVFWFHGKDKTKAEKLITQTTPLKPSNTYTNRHHYLGGVDRVAKLFADDSKKSAENEIFYKALNQSLNAMVYYRNRGSIIKSPNSEGSAILTSANYPVIICNSFENLYGIEIDTDADPFKITEDFLLEVNYAYMTSDNIPMNEYFLIDILNFDLLDSFLVEIIEKEVRSFNLFAEK